jgi:hypothetical protein
MFGGQVFPDKVRISQPANLIDFYMHLDLFFLVIFAVVLISGIFGTVLFVQGWRKSNSAKLIGGFLLLALCVTVLFGTIWLVNNVMLHKIGG